jgi:hypothetical protein
MRTIQLISPLSVTFALCASLMSAPLFACDATQQIQATVKDKVIDQWSGTSDTIRSVSLENGFKLGIKIEETSREKYEAYLERTKQTKVAELVRISLYDMTGTAPRKITSTWGGTNSKQGYGPRGGADRVDEVGESGILFVLSKANCAAPGQRIELSAEAIAKLPTAAMLKQTDEPSQPSAENLRGRIAALAEMKSGTYRFVYPDTRMPSEQLAILKKEIERAGLVFTLESEFAGAQSRGYVTGYARAMMEGIEQKLGRTKMREMEANLKSTIASHKPATALQ